MDWSSRLTSLASPTTKNVTLLIESNRLVHPLLANIMGRTRKETRTPRRRPFLVGASVVALIGALESASWWLPSRTPVRTLSGTVLGRLPAGVRASDLNLLIVTLDTTRADRIGAYGYAGVQTPNLDRLAREGVLFEQAASSAPLTLPAHSSLFTSKFPPEHGVRDNGGFFLAPRETTLATVLKGHGYRTGAFVGAYVLDAKWGINQGFDTYFDDFDLSKYKAISLGAIQRPGNEVIDHGLQWLDRIGAKPPGRFFAWMHLYDPHAPYEPPEPYRSMYPDRPYIGEIAFADAQVGRVLSYLETHALLDRTIVVVMGDHGESLGDHGEATHGFFVYESVAHVPLIIRAPFSATLGGRRVADVVRSVDVMPTVRRADRHHAAGGHRRKERRGADDRRDQGSASRATPRRCIRCIISAGAICARCGRGATS